MVEISQWFEALYAETGINLTIFYDGYDAGLFITGLVTTLKLSAACVFFSLIIGIVGGWLRASPIGIVRWATGGYVHFFRNTPSLVQLYFFYFGVAALVPHAVGLDNFQWTVVALSLFGGAYNTEIFRAGIESVPRATVEAAEALGYSRMKTYIYVVLPIAFRVSLPALNNNLVTLVKGTTIGYAVGVSELLTASATIWASSANVTEMMNVLMVTYVALVSAMVVVMHYIERKLRIPGYHQ